MQQYNQQHRMLAMPCSYIFICILALIMFLAVELKANRNVFVLLWNFLPGLITKLSNKYLIRRDIYSDQHKNVGTSATGS